MKQSPINLLSGLGYLIPSILNAITQIIFTLEKDYNLSIFVQMT